MGKVLVIGLDGATFDLIDPWIAKGKLPVLARCIAQGTRANLQSTPLSNSAQAWSSFITGKNPGKHGIYDFFETLDDSYGVRFLNASFRKSQSLWRLVSDAGKKVGVINVPMSYPAEPLNGFLLPGLDAPGIDADFAYPAGLMDEIKREVGEYLLEPGIWGYIRQKRPEKALEKLLEMVQTRTLTAKYLMKNKNWDLFVVVYTATDKVQHHFWKYIDSSRPEFNMSRPYSNAIFQVYQLIDSAIGELLAAAGDASIIIMSDHGAGPSSRRTMYINRWLHKEGFLHYKNSMSYRGNYARMRYRLLEWIYNEIKKFFPRKTKEIMLRFFSSLRDKIDSVLFLPGIDWSKTLAYSRENHPAIFINTVGREVHGIVEPGEPYRQIQDQIVDKLNMLKCPDSGQPIVGQVFKRDDVYHGPETAKGPDIIFNWHRCHYVHRPSGSAYKKNFLEELNDRDLLACESTSRPSGIHRDNGIFIASGDPIKANCRIEDVRLYDLAPTILYLLGLSIPYDMDGHVLDATIEADYFANNPVRESDTASVGEKSPANFDLEETGAIKERLQGLGYID